MMIEISSTPANVRLWAAYVQNKVPWHLVLFHNYYYYETKLLTDKHN